MRHKQTTAKSLDVKVLVAKLKEVYGSELPFKIEKDLFKILIGTIMSQNTSDRLAREASKRFFERFRNFGDVLRADVEEIKERIRIAGLFNRRAERIKLVAKLHHEIEEALKLPEDEARRKLLSIPGIGDKTADILLLFLAERKAFPVDTHIFRVTKRLGFVPEEASYLDVSNYYKARIASRDELKILHFNLIRFGRNICKARNPSCHLCFLRRSCPRPQLAG